MKFNGEDSKNQLPPRVIADAEISLDIIFDFIVLIHAPNPMSHYDRPYISVAVASFSIIKSPMTRVTSLLGARSYTVELVVSSVALLVGA